MHYINSNIQLANHFENNFFEPKIIILDEIMIFCYVKLTIHLQADLKRMEPSHFFIKSNLIHDFTQIVGQVSESWKQL